MNRDTLQWLLITTSNAPIRDTNEARHKAVSLLELATRLDEAAKPKEAQEKAEADRLAACP